MTVTPQASSPTSAKAQFFDYSYRQPVAEGVDQQNPLSEFSSQFF